MKIIIFGGSFNPIHNGHIEMIEKAYHFLKADQVWVIPTFITPGKKQKLLAAKHRLKMIKLATLNLDYVKVKDFEIKNKQTSYTIDTIKNLKNIYMDEFIFLFGGDQCKKISSWKDIDQLTKMIQFVAIKRINNQVEEKILKKYNIKYIDEQISNISSTKIRNGDFLGLPKTIIKYIIKHNLFFEDILKHKLSYKRFVHSQEVAKMAQKLALKYYPEKADIAYTTGLLHDICKEDSPVQIAFEIKDEIIDYQKDEQLVWHQWAGAKFVKNNFLINDNNIISAIAKHTTADQEMSCFEKIIYCADKISIDRNYSQVKQFRKLVFANLDHGFIALLKNSFTILIDKGIKISPRSQKIKTWWLNESK